MFYEFEERALFWASLEALGDDPRIAWAVNILTSWAVQDPLRAAANEDGVRVLKLPSVEREGAMTPPLRLAFYLDAHSRPSGAAGMVVLLHVETYDEQQELLDGGSLPPGGN